MSINPEVERVVSLAMQAAWMAAQTPAAPGRKSEARPERLPVARALRTRAGATASPR